MADGGFVSLPQLVDLAIGSPEMGAVNFSVLRSLLHILIERLDLQGCAVRFLGSDSSQAAMSTCASPTATTPDRKTPDIILNDDEQQPALISHFEKRKGKERTRGGCSSSESSSEDTNQNRDDKGLVSKGVSRRRRYSNPLPKTKKMERLSEDLTVVESQVKTSENEEVKKGSAETDPAPAPPPPKETTINKISPEEEFILRTGATIGDAGCVKRVDGIDEEELAANVREKVVAILGEKHDAVNADLQNKLSDNSRALEQIRQRMDSLQSEVRVMSTLATECAAKEVKSITMRFDDFRLELDSFALKIGTLFRDRDQRNATVKELQSEMKSLDTRKADQLMVESALAIKADREDVSAKVSSTEFKVACSNMEQSLELTKIKIQETEKRLDSKLDRSDLSAISELALNAERNVNLRNSVATQISDTCAEPYAAGTKAQIIKNVHCISCDSPAVMRCEDWYPPIPCAMSFPERRSSRPYLTYEMAQVRRHRRSPEEATIKLRPRSRLSKCVHVVAHPHGDKLNAEHNPLPAERHRSCIYG